MPKTPAEQQMEELRRLREAMAKRKPSAVPKAVPVAAEKAQPRGVSQPSPLNGLELSEVAKKKKEGPSLALSVAQYRLLLERQRKTRAFKRRRDMGDWAAELLLALPFEAHRLSPEAKAELFKRMQEWAKARGLQ